MTAARALASTADDFAAEPGADLLRAGFYLRISADDEQEGKGVARQLADCRAEVKETALAGDPEVYADNDISAMGKKERPAFERLLRDLRAGRLDVLVVWHTDRLYRRIEELTQIMDAWQVHKPRIHAVTVGMVDFTTPSGRFMARQFAIIGQYEVEHLAERVARKKQELRESGMWAGGGRPFGFRIDRTVPGGLALVEAEANAIRAAAASVVAGASALTIAKEWNAAGITTVNGKPWTSTAVSRVLPRPRNAARVEHDGRDVGPAAWESILDVDTYEGVRAVLGDGAPRKRNKPRSDLLLSGVARCYCGEKIKGAGSNESGRRYRCSTGRHITRLAAPLDEFIEDVVLDYLPRPEAIELVARDRESAMELQQQLVAIDTKLKALAVMFSEEEIDDVQLKAGSKRLKERRAEVEVRLDALTAGSALDDLAGKADADIRWKTLSMARKRAVVDALLEITLKPGKRGGNGGTKFDMSTVTVALRVPSPSAG